MSVNHGHRSPCLIVLDHTRVDLRSLKRMPRSQLQHTNKQIWIEKSWGVPHAVHHLHRPAKCFTEMYSKTWFPGFLKYGLLFHWSHALEKNLWWSEACDRKIDRNCKHSMHRLTNHPPHLLEVWAAIEMGHRMEYTFSQTSTRIDFIK